MINLAICFGLRHQCREHHSLFQNHPEISVKVVLCNNRTHMSSNARRDLRCLRCFPNEELEETMDILSEYEIDYIILAGFLQKVPDKIIDAYRGRIINIHPALIPSQYGGKGCMVCVFIMQSSLPARKNLASQSTLWMKFMIMEKIFSRYDVPSSR